MLELALERAQEEPPKTRRRLAWFNLGTVYTRLGETELAVGALTGPAHRAAAAHSDQFSRLRPIRRRALRRRGSLGHATAYWRVGTKGS